MNLGPVRLAGGHVVTSTGTAAFDVVVAGGVIVALEPHAGGRSPGTIDVADRLVAPGYIDVQLNGGWGHDFTSDPTSIASVADRLPATGVTAFLPTIVTCPADVRRAALAAIADVGQARRAAAALGLHFEGPLISSERSGAHARQWITRPDHDELARWSREAGVAMVTLAPELEGALGLVRSLVAAGVVVSAGHSDCSAAQFEAARAAGVSMVTHLFNAMAPFTHRAPGLVGATLAGDVTAGLICDGLHVDPIAVRMAWRALGPRRTILVTDAMAALGIELADARLGETPVSVDETGVRTPDGVLAGSNLSLDRAVRNLVAYTGCTAAEAIRTVTANPAELLGSADRGRIEVGGRADLVVLDHGLRVELTMIGGEIAWRS